MADTTRNIRMLVAYDGTDFHGWQLQPGLRTVQEEIEKVIARVVRHPVHVRGAGRTDAGVHALGQVANFETTSDMHCDSLCKAVGGRLPYDISVYHMDEVPAGFQASFDAISKLYRYTLHRHPNRPVGTLRQRYAHHIWGELDVEAMRAAARYLVGTHDFAAFATKGSRRPSTVRTVLGITIHRHYEEIHIDVEGTGFLYNQVRNFVGTLLEVGRGHWPAERIPTILAGRDRTQAGPTAPARGLCMRWVRYDLTRPPRQAPRLPMPPDETAEPPPGPDPLETAIQILYPDPNAGNAGVDASRTTRAFDSAAGTEA